MAEEIAVCTRCALSETRTRTVPGQGSAAARIMFVGEAPGADEDRQGLAFVGRAGQLLTKMIVAMGLDRDKVFIANVLKCRPPGNRDPAPNEVDRCLPFLKRQIALIRPEILVALGGHAMKNLLQTEASVGRMRGRVHDYDGTPLVVTYHPAFLLRSPDMKRAAWEDLQLVLRTLGLAPPDRG
ncbi:MAG: uracil-DNA glycosylase [Planctomycetes bacterium]|nr:uracil-DNA glycosylase [Planctomycetota bacterium]